MTYYSMVPWVYIIEFNRFDESINCNRVASPPPVAEQLRVKTRIFKIWHQFRERRSTHHSSVIDWIYIETDIRSQTYQRQIDWKSFASSFGNGNANIYITKHIQLQHYTPTWLRLHRIRKWISHGFDAAFSRDEMIFNGKTITGNKLADHIEKVGFSVRRLFQIIKFSTRPNEFNVMKMLTTSYNMRMGGTMQSMIFHYEKLPNFYIN